MGQTWVENNEGAGGTTFKAGMVNLEDKLDSAASQHSGTSRPSYAVPGMVFYNSTASSEILELMKSTGPDTWMEVFVKGISQLALTDIPDGLLTAAKFASGVLSTTPADDTVTYAKIASIWNIQAKSTTYTAADQDLVVATLGSSWTLTLPAAPNTNDRIAVVAGAVTGTAALTISGGSKQIGTFGTSLLLINEGERVELLYNGTKWLVLQAYLKPQAAEARGVSNGTSAATTLTAVDFDTSLLDQAGLIDLATDKITMRRAATVRVTAEGQKTYNSSTGALQIDLNGSQLVYADADSNTDLGTWLHCSRLLTVSAGDYFTLQAQRIEDTPRLSVVEIR